MRHIQLVSILLLATGIVLVVLGEALNTGPTMTLIGLMLVIAGAVKVVTVRIWHGFFEPETPSGNLKGEPTHE